MSAAERAKRQSKRDFLNAFKAAVGCKDCGTSEGRLDFDHRDKTTKLFKVGANVCQSWGRLRDEIEKCDVRCASCHAKRHHRDEPGLRNRRGRPNRVTHASPGPETQQRWRLM